MGPPMLWVFQRPKVVFCARHRFLRVRHRCLYQTRPQHFFKLFSTSNFSYWFLLVVDLKDRISLGFLWLINFINREDVPPSHIFYSLFLSRLFSRVILRYWFWDSIFFVTFCERLFLLNQKRGSLSIQIVSN